MANADTTPLAENIVHVWTGEALRVTTYNDRVEVEWRPDDTSDWGPTFELPKEGPDGTAAG